jgi:folate-dependent phosphoribosylglycinamide formyltransferase PurN
MTNNFLDNKRFPFKIAIFMSGSGSNAEKILDFHKINNCSAWTPRVIVTDNPLGSRAGEIAAKHNIPLVELDIRKFYRDRGEKRVSLFTETGRMIRTEWTEKLRALIASYDIDFGILAGFVPLTNITSDFPCLNVHPGDLTVLEDGHRVLVGLHTVPVEAAILRDLKTMRSSVIIAQAYTGAGGEMDSGPILGVSAPVEIELMGFSIEYLRGIYAARPQKRPVGGFKDDLEIVAKHNQELLKVNGDWVVLPPVVDDFASGKFSYDKDDNLYYKTDECKKEKINTVEYSGRDKRLIFC